MKNNFYISFGVWMAILPFLGIPGVWRNAMISVSGAFLVIVVLAPVIFKKVQTRGRPRKKKETAEPKQNPPQISDTDQNINTQ